MVKSGRVGPTISLNLGGDCHDDSSGDTGGEIHRTDGGDEHETLGGDYHETLGGDCHGPIGVTINCDTRPVGTGYHPDLPDMRDRIAMHTKQEAQVAKGNALVDWLKKQRKPYKKSDSGVKKYRIGEKGSTPLPPVEDQGNLQSCTANAVISLMEYLLRRHTGELENFSRLFLYKTTRRLLGLKGDSGADIRTTIKALRLFGVPPEKDWPYNPALLDREPGAYQYSYGQNYRSLEYSRLDAYKNAEPDDTIKGIKIALLNDFPVAFGFPLYESINDMKHWTVPLPSNNDKLIGGHAVTAVGYDDSVAGGSLIIRNSWGIGWGDLGYAYLPFDYIKQGLAVDFWTIHDEKWLNTSVFNEPTARKTRK